MLRRTFVLMTAGPHRGFRGAFVATVAVLCAGPALADNFAFAPAPQQDLNRIYRVDTANGEVVACQFAVKDDSPIGLTLCYPAGAGCPSLPAGKTLRSTTAERRPS